MTGGSVSRSMSADVRAARRDRNELAKRFRITRQTKAGRDSKMADDTMRFRDLRDALAYIKRMKDLNPTRTIEYKVYNI